MAEPASAATAVVTEDTTALSTVMLAEEQCEPTAARATLHHKVVVLPRAGVGGLEGREREEEGALVGEGAGVTVLEEEVEAMGWAVGATRRVPLLGVVMAGDDAATGETVAVAETTLCSSSGRSACARRTKRIGM